MTGSFVRLRRHLHQGFRCPAFERSLPGMRQGSTRHGSPAALVSPSSLHLRTQAYAAGGTIVSEGLEVTGDAMRTKPTFIVKTALLTSKRLDRGSTSPLRR